MRPIRIVDASALACFCFQEPQMAMVERELRGAALFAPSILPFEIANICWKKLRKEPDAASALRKQFRIGMAVPITLVELDFPGIVDLAFQTGLTAYDASYLWLARSMAADLLTLDEKLKRVATASV